MAMTGKHAPWRLWILVFFWVLQYLFLALELAIVIIAIIALKDIDSTARITAAVVVQLILIVVSIGLTIFEPVQLARRRLTPISYLVSNSIKSVIWIGLTVASAVISSQSDDTVTVDSDSYSTSEYHYSPFSIVIAIALCLLFVFPAIYGGIVFHKNRSNRGTYNGVARTDPENLAMGGMGVGTVGNGLEAGHGHSEYYTPYQAPVEHKPAFEAHELGQQNYSQAQQYGQPQAYGQQQAYEPYAGAAIYR